ncbi:MAG: hypothetical protein KAY54_11270, partial [Burkholderiaceae bacterium]|nr:hypothetical protein [Burkholderiaceae bacterium]
AGIRRTRISRWPSTPRSESFWPIFRSMALPTQKKSIRSPFEADGPDIDQVGFLRARQDAAIDFESMQKSLKLNAALVHLTRLTLLLDAGLHQRYSRYKSQLECRKQIGGTRHLKRFSATWRMAFKTFRFERLTLSNCTGRQRSLGMNRI